MHAGRQSAALDCPKFPHQNQPFTGTKAAARAYFAINRI
jgi:hypothetical protein